VTTAIFCTLAPSTKAGLVYLLLIVWLMSMTQPTKVGQLLLFSFISGLQTCLKIWQTNGNYGKLQLPIVSVIWPRTPCDWVDAQSWWADGIDVVLMIYGRHLSMSFINIGPSDSLQSLAHMAKGATIQECKRTCCHLDDLIFLWSPADVGIGVLYVEQKIASNRSRTFLHIPQLVHEIFSNHSCLHASS